MLTSVAMWVAVVVAVLCLLIVRSMRESTRIYSEEWLPGELRGSELIYAEQIFRAKGPVEIVAKVDRGYRDKRGVVVLMELKTRPIDKPFLSDVIELSVQRLAVVAQTNEPVAAYGYVAIQRPRSSRPEFHRVQLLKPKQVIALVERRHAILSGLQEADYARSAGLCEQCPFRRRCKASA